MNNPTIAHKRVLVLDEATELSELEALAAASQWSLVGRFPVGFDECVELQWSISSEVSLAYIEYHMDGVRVVSVRGTERDAVDAAADTVTGAMAASPTSVLLDELLREPAPDPVTLVRDWRNLASAYSLAHPDEPLDDRLVTAVERHLAHPNRQVRLRTIMVADALGGRWPKLIDLVLARKDEETELDYVVDAFVQMRDDQPQ